MSNPSMTSSTKAEQLPMPERTSHPSANKLFEKVHAITNCSQQSAADSELCKVLEAHCHRSLCQWCLADLVTSLTLS